MNANSGIASLFDRAYAPPIGFRKAITVVVKLQVLINQEGRCSACGKRLGNIAGVQFDHIPALGLRGWDPVAEDTIPPSNDVDSIFAKHQDCHKVKTTGRRGESRHSKVGGDISEIAKTRRLTKQQEEFRRQLLTKGEADDIERLKPKSKWPKRKFSSRSK